MDKQVKSGGIGCLTVVGIVFLVLKILDIEPVAHWSWLWVLCPFWIPLALGLTVGVFIFILAFLGAFRR